MSEKTIEGRNSKETIKDQVDTPEYSAARDSLVDAIEAAFDLYNEGRFQPDRQPLL